MILSKQDGLFYKKSKDVPFTGEVTGRVKGKINKGKREGEYLRYSKNGKLDHKGNYKDDKLEGEYLTYYPNGQLKRTEIYKDGELIKTIHP